jgi:hypothetical protein
MPENNPQSWFKQLNRLFDTVETSTNKVLKEVSNALNYLDPEAPITQEGKKTLNPNVPAINLNNSNKEDSTTNSPSDSTQKNKTQSVYDKAFEDFKKMYSYSRESQKVLNDPEENKNTITNEKQLKLEFNKRTQELIKNNLRHYNDNKLSELHNMHLRVAFLASFSKEDLQNPIQFDLVSRDPTSAQALPISEKQNSAHLKPITPKPNLPSEDLSALQQPKKNQQYFVRENPQYKKAPEEERPDIFSFFGQHLKTATTFLTSATSSFVSFIFEPTKTPNPPSHSYQNQQPKTTRELVQRSAVPATRIVPFSETEEHGKPIVPYYGPETKKSFNLRPTNTSPHSR